MNEYKDKLLKDALQENEEFPLRLLDVLKILPDTTNLINRVVNLFKRSSVINPHDTQTQIRDYRFKYLFLNNYRKFSPLTGDVHYYGLPFAPKKAIYIVCFFSVIMDLVKVHFSTPWNT